MIYDFIYAVLNQAILLPITADSQDTALIIFNTLNARGLPLSDADIFKAKIYNHLDAEGKKLFIEEWKALDEKANYITLLHVLLSRLMSCILAICWTLARDFILQVLRSRLRSMLFALRFRERKPRSV